MSSCHVTDGNGLIRGIPSSRAAFLDARAGAVQDAIEEDVGRRELNRRQTAIEDLPQPLLSRSDQASVSPDHIYLAPAGLLPVSGFSLSMPAMEVNLRRVIAWWLGKAEIHERKSFGSSMAFFIPLDWRQWAVGVSVCSVVLLNDRGRDPSALRDLKALLACPVTDVGQVLAATGGPGTSAPAGRGAASGHPGRCVKVRLHCLLESSEILLGQIDGVVHAVEGEVDL